jgi:hypothetical protein
MQASQRKFEKYKSPVRDNPESAEACQVEVEILQAKVKDSPHA